MKIFLKRYFMSYLKKDIMNQSAFISDFTSVFNKDCLDISAYYFKDISLRVLFFKLFVSDNYSLISSISLKTLICQEYFYLL